MTTHSAPARLPVRLPDWPARLTRYIAAAATAPFAPGRMDCALFAAGAVAAMTGTDPAEAWRGRYRTLAGGRRLMRRAGFADHEAVAAAHFAEVAVLEAKPGDLAVIATAAGPALGVVQGPMVYVRRPECLGLVGLAAARRAFRVP